LQDDRRTCEARSYQLPPEERAFFCDSESGARTYSAVCPRAATWPRGKLGVPTGCDRPAAGHRETVSRRPSDDVGGQTISCRAACCGTCGGLKFQMRQRIPRKISTGVRGLILRRGRSLRSASAGFDSRRATVAKSVFSARPGERARWCFHSRPVARPS